ncbi:methylamine utilization protein MauJ [Methanobacterium sp.]|uniref:methylamine utilization protein MauJ n=1 Tax=Methanobacterium sp. TaxID=2164 RepID=UPI003158AD9B
MKLGKNDIKELISLLELLFNIKSCKYDNKIIFKEKQFKLSISVSELRDINEKIHDLRYKDFYIFNKNYFEELLHVEGHPLYIQKYFSKPIIIHNEGKIITYELSKPSLEYILLSFIKMSEMGICNAPSLFLKKFYKAREFSNGHCCSHIQSKFNSLKIFKTLESIEEILPGFDNITIDDSLRNFIESQFDKIITLKIITTENETSDEYFFDLADSFRFRINYHTQIAFIRKFEYYENSLETIKRINETEEIKTIPQKSYKKELLLYYEQALSTNDPVFRFLSFYHVLEYFFKIHSKKRFERDQIEDVMHQFLNKNELKKNIYKFDFSSYNHDLIANKDNLALDKLQNEKEGIIYYDYYNYLTTEKVNFADAKPLNDNKFIPTLAKRIYRVRNAIVHRKEGESKYLNYKKRHRDELKIELPLIRLIAEQFIINSSNELK